MRFAIRFRRGPATVALVSGMEELTVGESRAKVDALGEQIIAAEQTIERLTGLRVHIEEDWSVGPPQQVSNLLLLNLVREVSGGAVAGLETPEGMVCGICEEPIVSDADGLVTGHADDCLVLRAQRALDGNVIV